MIYVGIQYILNIYIFNQGPLWTDPRLGSVIWTTIEEKDPGMDPSYNFYNFY